jgi:hypothetical protein
VQVPLKPLVDSARVLIGGRDLILRVENSDGDVKEGRFRVTKMRCWRIMTLTPSQNKSAELVSSLGGKICNWPTTRVRIPSGHEEARKPLQWC